MNERTKYFVKQKLLGIGILIIALVCLLLGEGTPLLFLGPIAIGVIFTKEMVLTNDYYFKVMEKKEPEL